MKINPEVKDYLIEQYIVQCKKIHMIAFFQWRNIFVNYSDSEILQKKIEQYET